MGSIPTSVFLDKTVGIVIVEPTMSIASTIRRVFLESDYSNVYIAHSVLDAINTIGNNNINWVITSPLTEERLNQWHLLRIPLEVAAYSNIMVSVLVNPDNVALTEEYYAFGALSVHSRQLTYNTFQEEINALQLRLKSHANVEQAIAEDLRGTFNSVKDVQKLENLEETLLATIDTTPAQRMRTIEARFKAKSNLEAMMEIRDLFSKHPELANDLKILSQAYLGTSDIQTFRGPLPVKKVLILDPDVSQQQFLRGVFTELGAEVIVCCDTIDAACNSLHDDEIYDVIVTEWKLHDVKGHAFIQHVRHHGHERQPVFIHSSLVKPEDHALIGEIGGVFIITKPTSKEKIKRFLTETIERWNFPQEGEDQGEKILNVLNAGRL
ncbi:MAG: response regulator, partial [Bdellovibrionota bacterium]